jgi:DNA-binding response OmpR family regulator
MTEDGNMGLVFAQTFAYDVVVLDLMLPGIDGLTVLQRLRSQGNDTPVLILSAKDRVEDRVRGLHLGADDYLVKPFAFDELCARLNTLVRRRYQTKTPLIHVGPLVLDTNLRQVFRGDDVVPLTRNEFRLLAYLALRRGRVFSRDQLCEHLYPHDADVSSNVIEVTVYHIRRKLRQQGVASIIRTIRGQGYLIE